ncbi:MAG: hypothetical protein HUK06_07060 [Bacteroidaceae bacterium]|nr:hypothetical protein [Bacteroidaceae bacterium]
MTDIFSLKLSYKSDASLSREVSMYNDGYTTSTEFDLPKQGSTAKEHISLTFLNMSFSKQMYKPMELSAEFKVSGKMPTRRDLYNFFRDCTVDLIYITRTPGQAPVFYSVLQNGIVADVKPVFGRYARLVMTICSADYSLTLNSFCRSYTGKRFFTDVVKPQLEKEPWSLPLDYAKDEQGNMQTTHLHVLGYDGQKEVVQPYMVQYNESLYDFMARVAHRCGEFMYYEDGMFHIGLPCDKVAGTLKEKKVDSESVITQGKGSIEDPKIVNVMKCASVTYLDRRKRNENVQAKDFFWNTTTVSSTKEEIQSTVPDYAYDSTAGHDWAMEKRIKDGGASVGTRMGTAWKAQILGNAAAALTRVNVGDMVWKLGEQWGETAANTAMDAKLYNMRLNSQFVDKSMLWNGKDDTRTNEQRDEKKDYLYETCTDPAKLSDKGSTHFCPFTNYADNGANRFMVFDTAYYAAIADAATHVSANTVEVNLGTHYQVVALGDIVKLSNESTLYVVTAIRRTTTPVYYSDLIHQASSFSRESSMTTEREVMSDDKIEYIMEMVPLLMDADLKNLPSGSHLRCNVGNNAYLVLPPEREESDYRIAGKQRAFVASNYDPDLRGMLSIRYPWQKDSDDPSPWVRMTTEYAGGEGIFGGMFFRPDKGAEVIVDYTGGNVEQPYVIGQLYNHDYEVAGDALSIGGDHNHCIASKNHHGVFFHDASNAAEALGSVAPLVNLVNTCGVLTALMPPVLFNNENEKFWAGGMSFRDKFGLYNMSMSSSERNITFDSPAGDLKVNAFTGINFSAPCGDINIRAKNIKIKAGNTVTMMSGENIDRAFWEEPAKNFAKDLVAGAVGTLASSLNATFCFKVVDMGLVRHLYECIIKPIDGTLKLNSKRYLTMCAGVDTEIMYPDAIETAEGQPGELVVLTRFAEKIQDFSRKIDLLSGKLLGFAEALRWCVDVVSAAFKPYYLRDLFFDKKIISEKCLSFINDIISSGNAPAQDTLFNSIKEEIPDDQFDIGIALEPNEENAMANTIKAKVRGTEERLVLCSQAIHKLKTSQNIGQLMQEYGLDRGTLVEWDNVAVTDHLKTFLPDRFDDKTLKGYGKLNIAQRESVKLFVRRNLVKEYYTANKPDFLLGQNVEVNVDDDLIRTWINTLKFQRANNTPDNYWASLATSAFNTMTGMSMEPGDFTDLGKVLKTSVGALKPDRRGMILMAGEDKRTYHFTNGQFKVCQHGLEKVREALSNALLKKA